MGNTINKSNNLGQICILAQFDNFKQKRLSYPPWIDNTSVTKSTEKSTGFVFEYRKKKYIISRSTSVRGSNDIMGIYIIDGKIKYITLEIIAISEYGIAIMAVTNNVNDLPNIEFNTRLPKINSKLHIIHDIFDITTDQPIINRETIVATVKQNSNDKHISLFFPGIYMIVGAVKKNKDIEGIVGAPVFDHNNSVVGIINNVNSIEKKIIKLNILPSIYINRVLNELAEHRTYAGLCNIYFKGELVSSNEYYSPDVELNETVVQVVNENKLKYVDKNNKNIYLKKGDIILYVDNKKVDKNGRIYHTELDEYISIYSYISLNFYKNSYVCLKIFNPKSKTILRDLHINVKIINDMLYVPLKYDISSFKFKTIEFVELTEYILRYYINNYWLEGTILDEINKEHSNTSDKKMIVLLKDNELVLKRDPNTNIKFESIKKDYESSIKYYIGWVTKINKFNVKNVNEITKIISHDTTNLKISISFDKNINGNILYKNNEFTYTL